MKATGGGKHGGIAVSLCRMRLGVLFTPWRVGLDSLEIHQVNNKWIMPAGIATVCLLAYIVAATDQFMLVVCIGLSPLVGVVLLLSARGADKRGDENGGNLLRTLALACFLFAAVCWGIASLDDAFSLGILPPDSVKG